MRNRKSINLIRAFSLAGICLTCLCQPALGDLKAAKAFPRSYKAPSATVESADAPAGGGLAWRTQHFVLLSDQDIPRDTLQRFATTMESVPSILESHSPPLWSPIRKERATIRLCLDEDHFSELGGPAGSAGIFDGHKNEILIRADLFLSPPGGGGRLKQAPEEGLLIHEVSHFAMAGALRGSKPWLSEGLAEFLSVAHERGGAYRFNQYDRALPKHIHRHLALESGAAVSLPSISGVLALSHEDWSSEVEDAALEERYLPYATALLLVHYHLEGGNARRAEFFQYIAKLGDARPRRSPTPDIVLENTEAIEARLIKYWATRGLKLRFETSPSN